MIREFPTVAPAGSKIWMARRHGSVEAPESVRTRVKGHQQRLTTDRRCGGFILAALAVLRLPRSLGVTARRDGHLLHERDSEPCKT